MDSLHVTLDVAVVKEEDCMLSELPSCESVQVGGHTGLSRISQRLVPDIRRRYQRYERW